MLRKLLFPVKGIEQPAQVVYAQLLFFANRFCTTLMAVCFA